MKSISIHGGHVEAAMFTLKDIQRQYQILTEMTKMLDAAALRTTATQNFGKIKRRESAEGSRVMKVGRTIGKLFSQILKERRRCQPQHLTTFRFVSMRAGDRQTELFAQPTVSPDGFVYIRDFISTDEEAALIAPIECLPLQSARYREFTAKRRTMSFGAQYDFTTNTLGAAPPLPEFLAPVRDRVASAFAISTTEFTHALVTEYKTGAALGWHRDALQFGIVIGISLASSARMRPRPYPPAENKREGVITLELAARSAYVITGDARWRW